MCVVDYVRGKAMKCTTPKGENLNWMITDYSAQDFTSPFHT